ncbi:dihydropteroate synthase [bacterium]|nr:dihydropteroate synthase [bacterium]NCQ55889.1 dihydropteroate synthase [Candidatus Parcubacteria bacterium]NCS67597.1 dihydropteroate synthase [Candidatus Peregrinibacteria bacterium]NCS96238.1 dihydropteroate synthase [bacterium]
MAKIMGILNITPDSFSDGGLYANTDLALTQAKRLITDGADLVDVGAESTKPGANAISPTEEWERMSEFWQGVVDSDLLDISHFSLDTRNPSTAEQFLKLGGKIINDVSGFQDPEMIVLAAEYQATCVVNHFPGKSVGEVHEQKISSISQVTEDLLARAKQMIGQGVDRNKIILDPGIGFGKTPELNWALLAFAAQTPEFEVLIGHSKKRFLGEDRFGKEVNLAAAKRAIETGAAYLRVHEPAWYR